MTERCGKGETERGDRARCKTLQRTGKGEGETEREREERYQVLKARKKKKEEKVGKERKCK